MRRTGQNLAASTSHNIMDPTATGEPAKRTNPGASRDNSEERGPEEQSALNRLKMDRSSLTKAINRITDFCCRVERGELSPAIAAIRQTHLQDELLWSAKDLRASLKKARLLGPSDDAQKFDAELDSIDEREVAAESLFVKVDRLVQATQTLGSNPAPVSKPSTIKPFTLSESHTPSELASWTKQALRKKRQSWLRLKSSIYRAMTKKLHQWP